MREEDAILLRHQAAEVRRLRALLAAVTDPDGCSAEVLAEARVAALPRTGS